MPANLNALIRYHTINSCLSGSIRRWTIGELTDACSEALIEKRGRDELVSERTIRDDLRIMRSDILGFNAPIVQVKGNYFYSDPSYSIWNISITDSDLIEHILSFLQSIRSELNHPELENIIEKLKLVTVSRQIYKEEEAQTIKRVRLKEKPTPVKKVKKPIQTIKIEHKFSLPEKFESFIQFDRAAEKDTTWGDVLKLLG
jgi:hypothetical protein